MSASAVDDGCEQCLADEVEQGGRPRRSPAGCRASAESPTVAGRGSLG